MMGRYGLGRDTYSYSYLVVFVFDVCLCMVVLTACTSPIPTVTPVHVAATPTFAVHSSVHGHMWVAVAEDDNMWLPTAANTLTVHLTRLPQPVMLAADIVADTPEISQRPLYPGTAHISPQAALYLYQALPTSDTLSLSIPAQDYADTGAILRLVLTNEIILLPPVDERKDLGPQETITLDASGEFLFRVHSAGDGDNLSRGFSNADEFANHAFLYYPIHAVIDSLVLYLDPNGIITQLPSELVNDNPLGM